MTKFDNLVNNLKEMEWKKVKTFEDGTTLFRITKDYNNTIAYLSVIVTPEWESDITAQKYPAFYRITHMQDMMSKGQIEYVYDLKTEQDYSDFMSYLTYHYNHLISFN